MSLRVRKVLLILSLLGIVIAGYLTWVKLSDTEAFCGGVGDCSSVQNSVYGYIFGIPVSYPGLLAYLVLAALAFYNLRADVSRRGWTELLFFLITFAGFIFSAYLTYTELFLIHAVCPWCVASFLNLLVMTVLSGAAVFMRPPEVEV